jgi:hypothetical protein
MVPFAERGITNLRREVKLLLEPAQCEPLTRELSRAAAPIENRIVTIYFDSPDGALARRALEAPGDCVKIRAKRYHPDRSGHADHVVLEVKRERAGITSKERVWVPRAEVAGALACRVAPAFGRLDPAVATSFRRQVFQPCAGWRVTVDRDLTFHEAGWELLGADAAAWGALLPAPFGAEPRVIVELKHGLDGLPAWLAALAARAQPYSKFAAAIMQVAASRSVGA